MNLIQRTIAIVSAAFLAASCAESKKATVHSAPVIKSAKSAYVVKPSDSSREVDTFLKDAFAKKGLRSQAGAMSAKPAAADLYVTYVDRWHWDMAMYLRTLDIAVIDNKSGKEVATAMYRNSAFHGFPDVRKTTAELVNLIFAQAN